MLVFNIPELFYVDMLSMIMISLVSFVGIVVSIFSKNYMKGDSSYRTFFLKILLLLVSVIVMAIADNLLLFLTAWFFSNIMISQLIVHKQSWKAAQASGRITLQNFSKGFLSIGFAFAILYILTGSLSLQYIIHNSDHSLYTFIALILLLIGAMKQSAIWPFHRWLISSLNSPTPVSAIMHAGIVNGGGFLLARFAPLYFGYPSILNLIFVVGCISVLLGSFWKLVQNDIKRMLACSTMGQMGFMFVQCGLGLFSSAIAHLFLHGMFKAYMFLNSASAGQEKRADVPYVLTMFGFLLSLICGVFGSYIFSIVHGQDFFVVDTTIIPTVIVFMACCQLALTMLVSASLKKFPLVFFASGIFSMLYGAIVYFFDWLLLPLNLMQPQVLNVFHIIALILFVLAWFLVVCLKSLHSSYSLPDWFLYVYVKTLNSSQPDISTITSYRKEYDYE